MFQYVKRPDLGHKPKVLLLQGPVGPFFRDLHRELYGKGFAVTRVLFNGGDRVFSGGLDCERFSGSSDEWAEWLRTRLITDTPDIIILFGAMRPAHQTARQLAALHGVQVICLEEGYLRSGYITCEVGGNNNGSPLRRWEPEQVQRGEPPVPVDSPSSYVNMSVWGALYYLAREILSSSKDEALFHRRRESVLGLSVSWIAHAVSRGTSRLTSLPKLQMLRAKLKGNYMLVVLQVPEDSQLKFAARAWSNEKLIEETLRARAAVKSEQMIVFKLHPLDRRITQTKQKIRQLARSLDLEKHIMILEYGAIGEVVANAAGVIVINSTSAFSALYSGVPLLVMGDAIYRHNALATLGEGPTCIEEFLERPQPRPAAHVSQFFQAVKTQALLPGDFYRSVGRKAGAEAIVKMLTDHRVPPYGWSGAA